MDSKTLLEAYMRAKKLTQLKEVATELGFSNQYISQIRKGLIQVTDETAIKMAREIGIDPTEVIISLTAVRAEAPEVKAAWYDALKKYCASTGTALALGLMVTESSNGFGVLTAHMHFLC